MSEKKPRRTRTARYPGAAEALASRRILPDPDSIRKKLQEARAALAKVERPLLADLEQAGFKLQSVWDLKALNDEGKRYDAAIPVLLRWLPRLDNDTVKEGLIFALAATWVGPQAARPLLDQYDGSGDVVRDAIGWALGFVADESFFPSMEQLATDQRYGGFARCNLIRALAGLDTRRTNWVLTGLLEDEQVADVAFIALAKRRAKVGRATVERFLRHGDPAARRAARRLLGKSTGRWTHLAPEGQEPPREHAEWSVALDRDDLRKALRVVASVVEGGLEEREIAEAVEVAEQMEIDETRRLRFPVRVGGRDSELWLELFLDDEEALDLYAWAERSAATRLHEAWLADQERQGE